MCDFFNTFLQVQENVPALYRMAGRHIIPHFNDVFVLEK